MENPDETNDGLKETGKTNQSPLSWKVILGVSMMVLSTLIFFAMFGIPFLEISAAKKVTLTTISIVSMEVLWWLGVLILGKELWNKFKHYLNPKNWFRKRS
jgi:hypothetical protein